MDSFEFVQIPVAIVLGIGISEILSGWGYQLRHRDEQPLSGLQLVASVYVLLSAFRYLWIQWSSRPEVWDYAAYLLSVAPALVLALAAHAIRFDPSIRAEDHRDGYERYRRPVCWLLALVPVLQILRLQYIFDLRPHEMHATGLVVFGGLILVSIVFVRLATTDRIKVQWTGWGINWLVVLIFAVFVSSDLTPRNQ